MELIKATLDDIQTVRNIVQITVSNIYPKYYPGKVVEFFINYHNEESIQSDIELGYIYLLKVNNLCVGTGSINDNSIGRFYVLPEYEGNGYGSFLLEQLEKMIASNYATVMVEASLPSHDFYLHRGYKPTEYHKYEVEDQQVLCYYILEKAF